MVAQACEALGPTPEHLERIMMMKHTFHVYFTTMKRTIIFGSRTKKCQNKHLRLKKMVLATDVGLSQEEKNYHDLGGIPAG